MPGFNGGTVPQAVLMTLQTPEMELSLNEYVYAQLPALMVPTERGITPVLPFAFQNGERNAGRPTRVARGAPTPKTNSEWGERPYISHMEKLAHGIDDLSDLEASEFDASMQDIMGPLLGHSVKTAHELQLDRVLRGLGTAGDGQDVTIQVLTNAQKFDNYSVPGFSDVDQILGDMIRETGGKNLLIGRDVADALRRHPQFSNVNTGGAASANIIGLEELVDKLRGIGFLNVWIAGHAYQGQARELGYRRNEFFSGVVAVWRHDALKTVRLNGSRRMLASPENEEVVATYLAFDSYRDEDTEVSFVRAKEHCGIFVPWKEGVQVLQDVLGFEPEET